MSRQRVRRSFTVEVKSGTRQSASLMIPSRVQAAPRPEPVRAPAWDIFAPAAPAAPRVLPSLLVPEAPPEAEPAPVAAEPPLPRVRRVKRVVKAAAPLRDEPEAAVAEADAPSPDEDAAGSPSPALPERSAKRRLAAGAGAPLRRGERWKRRLPQACW
ncbi:hypothetical protein [Methylobacterium sp. sgz302541]|uniref:hypothetical protein n=1 Tax=unclassified Methylobacterium TaxID=2615210 RepID=UPI003D353CAE